MAGSIILIELAQLVLLIARRLEEESRNLELPIAQVCLNHHFKVVHLHLYCAIRPPNLLLSHLVGVAVDPQDHSVNEAATG